MSPKLSRWKSVFSLACALISLAACSDDTEDPVRSKAQMLYGTWDLQAAQDVGEGDLEFSYTFQADGSVRNRIGGAFLAELRNIDAVRQALDDGRWRTTTSSTVIMSTGWALGAWQAIP